MANERYMRRMILPESCCVIVWHNHCHARRIPSHPPRRGWRMEMRRDIRQEHSVPRTYRNTTVPNCRPTLSDCWIYTAWNGVSMNASLSSPGQVGHIDQRGAGTTGGGCEVLLVPRVRMPIEAVLDWLTHTGRYHAYAGS